MSTPPFHAPLVTIAPTTSDSPVAMLVVSAPSCAGKDALLGHLLAHRPELRKPVTTTTRPPRRIASGAAVDEIDGVHYYFRTEAQFSQGVEDGAFIEWAYYGANRYGLTHAALEATRAAGGLPIVILDVQGAAAVRQLLPVATLFIDAPLAHLERRMRAERAAAEVADRLAAIPRELAAGDSFEYRLANPDGALETAAASLCQLYDHVLRPRLLAFTPSLGDTASDRVTAEAAPLRTRR